MLWQDKDIHAVVFDAFGTVIDYPEKRYPYAKLANAWPNQNTFKHVCMTRSVSVVDLATELGRPDLLPTIQTDLATEYQHLRLYPEVAAVLGKLQQLGVKTAVCSNLAHAYGDAVRTLLPQVDATILSYEVGHAKPDMPIYACVEAALSIPKQHILFVGDTKRCDFDGPLAYGFHAVWLQRGLGHNLVDCVFPNI